ncbi:calpain-like protease PalB/Rim13 [Phycomyces blakesleeanus NRRL 1555(-)]|uniref:Calpain-like protease PalB/Rim13 n=1 Tax=Phycomyces blakesleeanus (strain ATCC 8743b / DSM 1359 / FGSC 10004 / NBRC 33097 / NRRL 1555) TaxID=763407 RepID=A0A167JUF2_PHYB8|nr:calpain-like protease PalB/Rim13 [Phycomyces blakesleeanus NRRL 1555(-)]OAD66727.1 calpain-like protease PalB/Rim13 [Phycomyces blakesleeanus NRRL 1555(-)]|eukprot:XP_018284767.1 calpain-like protease PalB/Rim13 [Phycomyces blakesleeanus NRRL 1555(-)]
MAHSRDSLSSRLHCTLAQSSSTIQQLYTDTYLEACKAVKLDQQGKVDPARDAYRRVIQMFSELLKTGRVDAEQLKQKLNEYVHRLDQLDRLQQATARPPLKLASSSFSTNNDSDSDEEWDEFSHVVEKAQFALNQARVNEEKDYNDQALEYYSEAAECYLAVYKELSVDHPRRIQIRNMFTTALDRAEIVKAIQKTSLVKLEKQTRSPSLSVPQNEEQQRLGRLRSASMSSVVSIPADRPTTISSHNSTAAASNSSSSLLSTPSPSSLPPSLPLPLPSPSPSPSPLSLPLSSSYSNSNSYLSFSPLIAEPVDQDILSHRLSSAEIEVLKYTSNVNGKVFLPWVDSSDLKEKFSFEKKFLDPDGSLRLSDKQLANFGGWKRPSQFMHQPQMIRLISSTNIIQDIVTDCSFVASLCVAAAYEQKFNKQLITSCIYPQDSKGRPCYNPNGKYVIKLVFNGISRKVVVDDLLPLSQKNTLMCTFSADKEELWASIIEKAYMKLMGGYDFPGSNSGIDLYCLTGWIPEHLFIHDEKSFVPEKVWNRIIEGAKYGDVLVTIATGEMTEEEASSMGLVPTHAYAVVDIKMVENKRFMQVKNPWSHKRWNGPYSHMDTKNWTPQLMQALNYDPTLAGQRDDGIFWIDFESVCSYFTSIHLNWNPELFTHQWVLHSKWRKDIGPKKDIYNLGYNPQFRLRVNVPDKKPAAVWLLLSKHIMVTEENTDYITLHIYNNTNGERVFYPGEPFKEGTYVNSPHILVRFNAPPGISDYTIVVSQHEKERSLYFTLRSYSLAPIQLTEVPMRYSIEQKIRGEWTDQTAGGNASSPSFLNNPQWKITIPSPESDDPGTDKNNNVTATTGILLMLEAPKSFAVNLMLVEGGKRVSRQCIPGSYTVVASTFEADLIGKFILTVASLVPLTVDPIPAEGAGMFRKIIHGEWIRGYNAMGCVAHNNYSKNPRYLLDIRELTTVKIRLQAKNIEPTPSMNITLYEKHPKDTFGQEVATSGPYTNVIQGVATNDIVLGQNGTGYLAVFATHDKDIAGEFTAFIYSDRPVNVRSDRS